MPACLFFIFIALATSAKQNDSLLFQKRIDSLETAANLAPDDTSKVEMYLNISKEYHSQNPVLALADARKAFALSEKLHDKNKMGECLNYLGDIAWFSGDYATASDDYFKALKNYEELNNKEGMADCYRNIGWIYQGQQQYKQTLEYYLKALEINTQLHLTRKMVANYDDLGIVYKMMKDYPKALGYCQKTIKLASEFDEKKGIATGYGNLASIYFAMGQYDLAVENFLVSSKGHEEIKDYFNAGESYVGLAETYFQLENYYKTIEIAQKAADIGKKYNYKTTETSAYRLLAYAYSKRKDYVNAFKYMECFSNMKDSTYNEKSSRQINEMSAKYDSEKKELMISALEKDKTLFEEKSAQDKKFKIFMILFSLIVAAFSVFLFRGNLQKKKANSSLSLAYKEIEVKNKDITDSINYARQIQTARLPNPETILHFLPETFGLYKPKDVVSGDFYWFAEHENGKVMLAAADCTGHGIPGAFMSMIGIDELNHATLEKRLSDPSAILSLVNLGVKKALRQNEQNSMSRDGMDIALCIFDLKNNVLDYAGANRPLYFIRNKELIEVAPTKAAIGGLTDNAQIFKSHRIELKKNDMIYVFTDGFADQFGGPQGKKFMTKRFKELLLSIHLKPIAEQEKILEQSLLQWQDNNSQVDDILVLGIRI